MNQTYMKEKPVLKLILSMSLPMMLSMMVSALYNIIDSIFVAKIGENAMTAISLVYPMQNLITAIAVGFGVGINAVIAYNLGAGKRTIADEAATTGLVFSIIHGIILTVLGLLLMPKFLGMFTNDKSVINLGLNYSNIVLLFTTVIMAEITYEKIFQSIGRMVISMASMSIGCIVNIILDPIMIFGFGIVPAMGIKGAAYATGISQVISLLIYIAAYYITKINVKILPKHFKPSKHLLKNIYSIGIPASLNMALPSLLVSALNGILASISAVYVVVLGIYYKLQTFIYLPANGIIQGMRPIMSYNYGAGEKERVRKIYKISLLLIVTMMLIGTVLCIFIPEQLAGMFTSNVETLKEGKTALRIISIGFIISSFSVTSQGALEALGKGKESLVISLMRYMIVIIPLAFVLGKVFGAIGVWNAFWITEIIAAGCVALCLGMRAKG